MKHHRTREYNLNDDIQSLLTVGSDAQRAMVLDRIVAHILAHPETRLTLLERVGTKCCNYFLREGKNARAVFLVNNVLAPRLYEGGWSELPLDLWRAQQRLEAGALWATDTPFLNQDMTKPEPEWTTWLFNGLYAWLGVDSQRSITWALQLLEWFALFEKQSFQRDRADGSEACNVVLMAMYDMVGDALTCPSLPVLPVKRWFERLIERMATDEAALQIFRDIVGIFKILRSETEDGDSGLLVRVQPADIPLADSMALSEEYIGRRPFRFANYMRDSLICLRPEHHDIIVVASTRETGHLERKQRESREAAIWANIHEEALTRGLAEKLADIRLRPRRFVRPAKRDFVDITVPILHHAGIRGVIFDAEGCTFPNVFLDIVTRGVTPHLVTIRLSLNDFLEKDDGVVSHRYCRDAAALLLVLRVVIVDILHRIVIGNKELAPIPSRPRQGSAQKNEEDERPIIRRAHLRHLREGHAPGKEAMERAQKKQVRLPDGFTFVKAVYDEEEGLTHDLPSEPFAIYTKDDLQEALTS